MSDKCIDKTVTNEYGWTSFEQANADCLAAIQTMWSERNRMSKELVDLGIDSLTILKITKINYDELMKVDPRLSKEDK